MSPSNRRLKNPARAPQVGMSLIEIMIAVAVASGLALGLATMLQQSAKATKSAAVSADWTSLKQSIFQALTTFTTCDPMMVNLGSNHNINVDHTLNYDADHAVEVPELAYPLGPTVTTIAKVGQALGGYTIRRMKLWAISPPDTLMDGAGMSYRKYTVRLQVEAERDAALAGGGQVLKLSPYSVDFKVLTGPFQESGAAAPVLRGCVPL